MNQDNYRIGRVFEPTACLSPETLLRYIQNQLQGPELHNVERHLIDCPLCSDAVEGAALLGAEEYAKQLATMASEDGKVIDFKPNRETETAGSGVSPHKSRLLPYFSIAAAVVLLIAAAVLFTGKPSAGDIADEYFELYEVPTTRGGGATDPNVVMGEGKDAFKAGNYAEAVKQFELVDTGEANFLAGECYYKLRKFEEAAAKYQQVIASNHPNFAGDAKFSLALTQLQLDDIAAARAHLEAIAADPNYNDHDRAKKVIAKLDKIEAR